MFTTNRLQLCWLLMSFDANVHVFFHFQLTVSCLVLLPHLVLPLYLVLSLPPPLSVHLLLHLLHLLLLWLVYLRSQWHRWSNRDRQPGRIKLSIQSAQQLPPSLPCWMSWRTWTRLNSVLLTGMPIFCSVLRSVSACLILWLENDHISLNCDEFRILVDTQTHPISGGNEIEGNCKIWALQKHPDQLLPLVKLGILNRL